MRFSAGTPLLLFLLLAQPVSARADSLTVKTGETWQFSLFRGQPVRARKAAPNARPGPGQIQVSVRAMMGTTMTIVSNNPVSYTYKAELIGSDRPTPARSCTLPADARTSFEHWPDRATAIRLSNFKTAPKGGACP